MHDNKIRFHSIHSPYHRVVAPALDKKHRCSFGSSGRCPCGLHRDPERAFYVLPLASDRERLAVEL